MKTSLRLLFVMLCSIHKEKQVKKILTKSQHVGVFVEEKCRRSVLYFYFFSCSHSLPLSHSLALLSPGFVACFLMFLLLCEKEFHGTTQKKET